MNNNVFDPRMYYQSNAEFGVYQTRRYPKGSAPASNPGDIEARAPSAISLRFANPVVAAHAQVERWTYTVPQNRKAIILAAIVETARVSIGAGTLQQSAIISLIRFGGKIAEFIRTTSHNDAVGSTERINYSGGNQDVLMFQGDRLFAESVHGSGDVAYIITAHLIEFNATESVNRDFSGQGEQGASASGPTSLLQGAPRAGHRTTIRVVPGSEYPYIAQGWTYLGGGFLTRIT